MYRALILLVAVLLSFALVVVASADPPDPTWIAGCWDDDDQDVAIIAILAIPGWAATAEPIFVPVPVTVPLVPIAQRSQISYVVLTCGESRAPPFVPPHRF
jgi:hypothetical protein